MTEHTIEALCQRSRDISLEKGWLNEDGTDPRPFHTVIGLFHSELSEAFEEIRSNRNLDEIYYEVKFKESDGSTSKEIVSSADIESARKTEGKYGRGRDFLDAKPCGIPIEFADYVIRVAQYAGSAHRAAEIAGLVESVQTAAKGQVQTEDAEEFIGLMHLDASMALLLQRSPQVAIPLRTLGLPTTPYQYLAASIWSLFAFCEKKGIDLWKAIDEKEAYNRTRSIRHGGKKM